jgi:uncharacterized protein (TIGR03382 family)
VIGCEPAIEKIRCRAEVHPMLTSLAFLSLVAPPALAEAPLGTEFAPAVAVDITPTGLEVISAVAPALVPADPLPIEDVYLYEIGYDPVFGWIELYEYELTTSNVEVSFSLDSISLDPTTGKLNVTGAAYVWVNDAANPMTVSGWAEGLGFLEVGETCTGWIDPTRIDISTAIGLSIDPKTRTLDATVDPIVWTTDLGASEVNLDCTVGDIIELLDFIGIDLIDLLLPLIEPTLADTINGLIGTLETTLEDAFGQANISTEVDLLGKPLTVAIQPSAVSIEESGVRLELAGTFDVPADPCVDPYGFTGSVTTPGALPPVSDRPADVSFAHHVGAIIEDDFVNSALYAVYASGVLCQKLDSSSDLLPIALDTSILGVLHPSAYDPYFPEAAPIAIDVRPVGGPPVATPIGARDVNATIPSLNLDFYAELDGRYARMVGTEIDVDLGIDVNFDDSTGVLALDVPISGDNLNTRVTHNEYAPNEDSVIAGNVSGLFDSLVGPLIGDLLGSSLSFELPSFSGVGLAELEVAPAGATEDLFGAYATVGLVSYGDPNAGLGCDSKKKKGGKGGCAEGCSGGCDASGSSTPAGMLVFLGAVTLLRRRRDR